MFVFQFDVCISAHDSVKVGRLCDAHMIIDVLADSDSQDSFVDAQLVACQMAGIHGGMVTAAQVRI